MIGFSVNAPIGPIGVFCIRRTLADGLWGGLFAGFGAAAADGIFGLFSAATIHGVSLWLGYARFWMAIVGGSMLLAFAVYTFMRPPVEIHTPEASATLPSHSRQRIRSFFLALGFTIINPLTILLFAAIFAGIDPAASPRTLLLIVLGLFLSALICWTVLALLTNFIRLRLGKSMMTVINRISAAAFAAYGVWAIASAFMH